MASQLNFDDLKERRTGLDNFFDILPAIKHLRPDLRLGSLLPERISGIEAVKGERALRR